MPDDQCRAKLRARGIAFPARCQKAAKADGLCGLHQPAAMRARMEAAEARQREAVRRALERRRPAARTRTPTLLDATDEEVIAEVARRGLERAVARSAGPSVPGESCAACGHQAPL